jgi:multidrug efflux pump subunit AcrB
MNKKKIGGAIAWMARNSVAANIVLFVFMVGGLIKLSSIKQEIFPEFTLDFVTISVIFPGASPDEVETGVVLPIEETVRGIDGVKQVKSNASEGMATVTVECLLGASPEKVAEDIKSAVDQIRVFPKDAEKPVIKRIVARSEVISLIIHGDAPEESLRHYAEMAREDLLQQGSITLVDLVGVKNREIAVEIPQHNLIAHNLTLGLVADQLSLASVEVSGGQLKTSSHNLTVKTNDKRHFGEDYGDVVIKSSQSGESVTLRELAQVKDTFEEEDKFSRYNGKPAVMVKIFRTGEQKPIDIAKVVKNYQETLQAKLPHGISSAIWNDYSSLLSQRIELLLNNALMGLLLVFFVLGLFLEMRLAFWVTMGIPSSFLGAFLLLPYFGVSVNMLSLFAFIIVLGMVVDDAIVIGENIYSHRQNNEPRIISSIRGTKELAMPVVFSILTTMAAFLPLFFVPGVMGKFFYVVPSIVITVLFMSLMEALFVLPNHLAHAQSAEKDRGIFRYIHQKQQIFSTWFMGSVEKYYRPLVYRATKYRYTTVAISLALLMITVGIIAGGRLKFSFMPNMDSDIVLLHAEYPVGQTVTQSQDLEAKLTAAADRALEKLGGNEKALGFYSQIGSTLNPGGPGFGPLGSSGGHIVDIMVYLVSTESRSFSSEEFSRQWERELGEIPGLKSLTFKSTTGPDTGKAISLSLKHKDVKVLENAASRLAESLHGYQGLNSIEDGIADGKEQIELKLKEHAHDLGISSAELGMQVRNAFFGREALRRQRGRDEVKVMVRLPKNERDSIYDIENFRIQSRQGEVYLQEVADIKHGISYSHIKREDGARVLTVSASINEGQANANDVIADLKKTVIPELEASVPGLTISQSGEQREQAETMKSLMLGFMFALVMIYALIAIPLKSYIQPLIIMSAIPFGIIGATIGHLALGFNLSVISMMGIVALSGIVVNDSLVFVHAANELLAQSPTVEHAIADAGVRRFRPILLTSLTTFFGLVPMILETSLQARFLIPMAVSIGFGVMFSTIIILVLVPALYVIAHDLKGALHTHKKAHD